MKCNECIVEDCETRDFLKRKESEKLNDIVERNCNEFKPKL